MFVNKLGKARSTETVLENVLQLKIKNTTKLCPTIKSSDMEDRNSFQAFSL